MEADPFAEDFTACDGPADCKHVAAVSVVGAVVAVFSDGSAELGHDEDDGVVDVRAEVFGEG